MPFIRDVSAKYHSDKPSECYARRYTCMVHVGTYIALRLYRDSGLWTPRTAIYWSSTVMLTQLTICLKTGQLYISVILLAYKEEIWFAALSLVFTCIQITTTVTLPACKEEIGLLSSHLYLHVYRLQSLLPYLPT